MSSRTVASSVNANQKVSQGAYPDISRGEPSQMRKSSNLVLATSVKTPARPNSLTPWCSWWTRHPLELPDKPRAGCACPCHPSYPGHPSACFWARTPPSSQTPGSAQSRSSTPDQQFPQARRPWPLPRSRKSPLPLLRNPRSGAEPFEDDIPPLLGNQYTPRNTHLTPRAPLGSLGRCVQRFGSTQLLCLCPQRGDRPGVSMRTDSRLSLIHISEPTRPY